MQSAEGFMMKAFYWNSDNFEKLLNIAKVLREDPFYISLAMYCELREEGLRKQAFVELDRFLNACQECSISDQRKMIKKLLDLSNQFREDRFFFSDPLLRRLIHPVLKQWFEDEPENAYVARWVALLPRDYGPDQYAYALKLNPEDDLIRGRLIDWYTSSSDHALHHLDESIFIGDVDECLSDLKVARQILEERPAYASYQYYLKEIEFSENTIQLWVEFNAERGDHFFEWYQQKYGKIFEWK